MSKRTESLTGSKTGLPIQAGLLMQPFGSLETLTHMKQCEAREWIRRYRAKATTDGAAQANQWWRLTIGDIERIRGLEAAIELRHLMNLERKK